MKHERNGFTLIEVLIVLAIVIVVAVVAYFNLGSNRNESNVNDAAQQIVASARQAQSNAASQVQDATWGIHFANPANATPFYALFKGSAYSTTSTLGTYPLPTGVAYVSSTIASGGTLDVTFSPISGAASASTSITVYSLANPSFATTIFINSLGLVSFGTSTVSSSGSGSGQIIWVVDKDNNRVQEFSSTGTYIGQLGCASRACSDGGGASGTFDGAPYGIAISPSGTIWVSELADDRVQEFSATGTHAYIMQLGCASGQCAESSASGSFISPYGVAVDPSGNIWVVDPPNNRVEKFSARNSYLYSLQLGCASGRCNTSSTNGTFNTPHEVYADPASGNVWVTDTFDARVEEFNSSGTYLRQLGCGGSGGCSYSAATGSFSVPNGLYIDGSNIWASDALTNNRVQEFSDGGSYNYKMEIGCGGCATSTSPGMFNYPWGIAIDASGNIWVADDINNRVEEFNSSGNYIMQIGCGASSTGGCAGSSTNGWFDTPTDIAIH